MAKRIIYVLIGPPAVGKSTWISNHTDPSTTFVVNRDDIEEKIAHANGLTYDDLYVFPPDDAELGDFDGKYGEVVPAPSFMTWRKTVFEKITRLKNQTRVELHRKLEEAKNSDKNIVLDLTNVRYQRINSLACKTPKPV